MLLDSGAHDENKISGDISLYLFCCMAASRSEAILQDSQEQHMRREQVQEWWYWQKHDAQVKQIQIPSKRYNKCMNKWPTSSPQVGSGVTVTLGWPAPKEGWLHTGFRIGKLLLQPMGTGPALVGENPGRVLSYLLPLYHSGCCHYKCPGDGTRLADKEAACHRQWGCSSADKVI